VLIIDVAQSKKNTPHLLGKRWTEKNMAVKIRLKRTGKKKAPSYRVVIADARSPRDGRIIENIGWYNPRVEPSAVNINEERAISWLNNGALPTETVTYLLKRTGILGRFEEAKAATKAAGTAAAE
jgi:small subunit ribosomal protein S16